MWEALMQPVPGGVCCHILQGDLRLSFREHFTLLETNPAFARWFTDTLAATEPAAFFLEHPPLTNEAFDDNVEFVLIESASLARLRPDPEAFAPQFASQPEAEIVSFPNLSGDAVLVVPK